MLLSSSIRKQQNKTGIQSSLPNKKKRAKQNRAVVQPRVPKISNIKSSLIIFSIEQNKMFSIYSISGCKISNVRYQYLRGSQ